MELNLSHLLEKKEVDIRLGDNVFTGVISASVIDIVQNQSMKQIKKLLKSKKVNLSAISGKNQSVDEMDKDQMFNLFDKLNIDIADLIDANDEGYSEVVQAFFGTETYAVYAQAVEGAGVHVINKQIYDVIVAQIQADTKANTTSEKNE